MLANIGGRRNAKTITNKQEKIGPTGNANVTRTAATFHGPISADVPLVRSDVIHFLLTCGSRFSAVCDAWPWEETGECSSTTIDFRKFHVRVFTVKFGLGEKLLCSF